MVKSYRGVQAAPDTTVQQQAVTVADYMSKRLITFRPEQSIDEVINTLLKHKISGGPVVDAAGILVGVISEGDCLKEVVKGKYNNSPNMSGKVADHMATEVVTISPETNIFDAAQKFLSMRIRRFPVLRHGQLVGQISQKDIMRAVSQLKNQTW